MELRDLEYFLAIAREGSLTGAARVLHLSQPGITRSLKALEEANAEKADELKAFFAKFDENEDIEVIAEGIVNFGGAFAECTEDEIIVPISVPGVKKGDKVGFSLSNGTSAVAECEEDDVVPVAFPKDAEDVGYVISAAQEETLPDGTTWTTVTDGDGNDTTTADSPAVKG